MNKVSLCDLLLLVSYIKYITAAWGVGAMDRIRRMLGCDTKEALGYTGRGVCVGVLDSGVAPHPDLRGRIAEFADFTGARRARFIGQSAYDANGHGTHVCGILAGNGAMSKGKYRGIASECVLLCGKVLDRKGGGSLKSLIDGMQWMIGLTKGYHLRVLNISIELDESESIDRVEWAVFRGYVDELCGMGVAVVAAAGNQGPAAMTLSPISECAGCICVGCHDGDYKGNGGRLCKEYSGHGPARPHSGDAFGGLAANPIKKPDIVAPGTDIISCGNKYKLSPYVSKSGTSMSAPIVSGACALCLQKYPKLDSAGLRRRLIGSARDLGESWSLQGAGMVQVDRMLGGFF